MIVAEIIVEIMIEVGQEADHLEDIEVVVHLHVSMLKIKCMLLDLVVEPLKLNSEKHLRYMDISKKLISKREEDLDSS